MHGSVPFPWTLNSSLAHSLSGAQEAAQQAGALIQENWDSWLQTKTVETTGETPQWGVFLARDCLVCVSRLFPLV